MREIDSEGGYKRTSWEIPVVLEIFSVLTVAMSVCSL